MARPGQLANAIAEVFDQDVATVRHMARILRDAGHMNMEKAGRGGGTMTPRDATNLLIAAAGASRVKYACRPVEQDGACRSMEGSWVLPFEGLPELAVLGSDHTFADAIEALLHAAIHGSVDPETGIVTIPGNQDLARLRVEIVMEEPYARSTIRVGLQGRDEDDAPHMINPVSRNYQMGYSDGVFDPPFQPAVPTDLTHTHSFSEKAIYRVAQEFR